MAIALTALKVSDWDTMKKNAGIGRTPTLKALLGQSAAVGPALAVFVKARESWNTESAAKKPTLDTAHKYFSAADKLREALEKFEHVKDLSDAAIAQNAQVKTLKDSVAGWKKEANDLKKKLAVLVTMFEAKLKGNKSNTLDDTLGTTGII